MSYGSTVEMGGKVGYGVAVGTHAMGVGEDHTMGGRGVQVGTTVGVCAPIVAGVNDANGVTVASTVGASPESVSSSSLVRLQASVAASSITTTRPTLSSAGHL